MKEKELNAMERKEIYQSRLKKLERFKEKMKRTGFRRIEGETYLVNGYLVLNR